MATELAAERSHPRTERLLYRCEDDSVFAYARGNEFIRNSDGVPWAVLSQQTLISARSGDVLAYRIGEVFFDVRSHEPLYYQLR